MSQRKVRQLEDKTQKQGKQLSNTRKALRSAEAQVEAVQQFAAEMIGEERAQMAFTPAWAIGGGVMAGAMEGADISVVIPEDLPIVGGIEVSAGILPGVAAVAYGIYAESRMLVEAGSGACAYVAGSVARQVAEDILGG